MEEKSKLSRKLKLLRERKGVTLYAAAKDIGLWKRSLQRLESSEALPERTPIATVLRLIRYYGDPLTISDFVVDQDLRRFARALRRKYNEEPTESPSRGD